MLRTRRVRDRRRDPRGGGHQAGRPPGPVARAARAARPAGAAPAHRPVGHPAAARRAGPLAGGRPPRPPTGHHRRRRHPQAARAADRRARRGHGRAGPADRRASWSDGAGRRRPRGPRRRSGRLSTRGCSSSSAPTTPRWSSSTRGGWPSGWPPGSTSWPRPRPTWPRAGAPTSGRASSADLVRAHHGSIARRQRLEIEDDAEGGPAARPRRHQLAWSSGSTWAPSTWSSRWRRRPPWRGSAAHRPGRPPGRPAVQGHASSRSSATTCSSPP